MSSQPKQTGKIRVDQAMVERGLAINRRRAQTLIMSGIVFCGTTRIDKPGSQISVDVELKLRGRAHPWVSRGGLKLAHALKYFAVDPSGKTCLDIGASTGGFTNVLLSYGATRVYAVDVGHGQIDWSLRQENRVTVLERTNARTLTHTEVPEKADLIVCDTSFIGLEVVLPAPLSLAAASATVIALIKPQFEVGRGKVGKGGVVRDKNLHQEVCERISGWLENLSEWHVLGITESPIKGPKGNKEFLIAASRYQC